MPVLRLFVSALFCAFAAIALGADDSRRSEAAAPPEAHQSRFLIQASVWTDHFDTEQAHTKHQKLIGVEWWAGGNWLLGAAAFRNSFDQPSQYVYMGKMWRPLDTFPLMHLKLTWGILHGYKGEYQDKIPLNDSGYAPVLVPSIGLSGKRFTTDLVFFGTAGVLLTVGVLVP